MGGAGLQPLKASSGSASDAVCHGRRRRVTESGVSAASCRDGVQNVCGRVMQLHLEEVSDVALCAATPSPYKRLMLTQDDDGGRRRGCDWEETRTAACIREGAVAWSGLVASTLLGVPADPWEGRRAGASLGGWEAGVRVRMKRLPQRVSAAAPESAGWCGAAGRRATVWRVMGEGGEQGQS